MNRLEEILRVKRSEIERLRPRRAELDCLARARKNFRGFQSALLRRDQKIAVVAEVKRASPSAGVISESFDAVSIARNYEADGADAISVLTDRQFFQGDANYLTNVREATQRAPLLRKDFILDELQIAEAAALGADAVLLIVAALEQKELISLQEAAAKYQLDALVEVHTMEELDRALDAEATIIGINNRDLTTFAVDLAVTEKLSEQVPEDVVLISESGIKTPNDVARLKNCGVNAVLVGEALMRGEISITALRGN